MDGELDLLGERIAEQAAHLDAAMHRLLADVREFDARGGWHRQGAMSCAHWLAWRVGWDLGTARQRVRVANRLGEFSQIDDALRRGEVSYSKVRAMMRVATPDNEFLLLEYSRLMTAAQLEKLCRKYALVQRHDKDASPWDDEFRRYVRRRDTEDGMVKIEAVLHPEEAEMVWNMLNHAAIRLTHAPAPGSSSAESSADPVGSSVAASQVSEDQPGESITGARRDPVAEPPDVCSTPVDSAQSLVPGPLAAQPASDHVGMADRQAGAAETAAAGTGTAIAEAATTEVSATAAEPADPISVSKPDEPPMATPAMPATPAAEQRSSATSVLQQRVDARRRAFCRADALVSISQAYLRGERPTRTPVDVTLTIPMDVLRNEASSDGSSEAGSDTASDDAADPVTVGEFGDTLVTKETARRLSCDAGVVEVVTDAQGAALSVGRKRRTIDGALKRALHKRDQHCTFPGCTNRVFLEGHHIKHWADGGETSASNCILACSFHHRYVHEYGYTIELGPDQRPVFRDPRGRAIAPVPSIPMPPDLGWPRLRAMNASLNIDAGTIACGWDGKPVRYGACVEYLVVADGLT